MSDLEARIAEVLAATDKAHAFRAADYSDRERPTFRCACGVATIGMHHEHHREALTAALLPLIREAQAEAWAEGHQAGWEEHENPGPFVNDYWDSKLPNPYKEES